MQQIDKTIETIRNWSTRNNMKLNEKKSGIVEFVNRRMRRILLEPTYKDFPICREYKYLGLRLTNKLSMESQMNHIKQTTNCIFQRLSPFLYKAELDTRKSLWQVFIQPLIELLYIWENSKYNIHKANSIIRGSFKIFTGLKKNTPNSIIDHLSGYHALERGWVVEQISLGKWIARKKGETYDFSCLSKRLQDLLNLRRKNMCKCLPKEIIHYINLSNSICFECNTPNTTKHLQTKHNLSIPDVTTLLQKTEKIQESKQSRREKLCKVKEIILPHLNKLSQYITNKNWFKS